jgi:Tol biopolymer transport system component
MRKFLLASVVVAALAVLFVSCGSDTKKLPVITSQKTAFAFIQEVSGGGFTPILGKFVVSGGNMQFLTSMITDPSTGKPVTAMFGDVILSPDGKKATFSLYGGLDAQNPSHQWDVYVANVDGTGNPVQITNDSYSDEVPQFSPDSKNVIFTSYRPGPNGWTVGQTVIRKADGTSTSADEVVLPAPGGAEETWHPTYSPDGSKIAFQGWGWDPISSTEYAGVFVMKADGTNLQMLTNPMSADCYCYDETPSFSADGTQITFSRTNYAGSIPTADIYMMKADGTAVTKLTDGKGLNADPLVLTIKGVGDRILFSSNRDGTANTFSSKDFEMYSMKTDGSAITRLTTNTLYDGFTEWWWDWSSQGAARRLTQQFQHQPRYQYQNHGVVKTLHW